MYKLPVLLLSALIQYACYGQEISGTWRGNYGKSLLVTSIERLEVDLELYNDTLVRGSSHLYYHGDKYEHYTVSGWYRKKDSTIYFSEDKEISVNMGFLGSNVMGNYTMKLSIKDSVMRLDGKWKENSGLGLMNTKAWLEKPIPGKRDTLKPEPKQVINEEKNEQKKEPVPQTIINEKPVKLLKTFEIDSADADSLTIEITDNARIDNDMISLFINNIAVIHKQVISHTPIVVHTALTKEQPESIIKMIAESYGSMPPCTARMSIITPRTTFTTNIESNYGNNGAVLIRLAK